MTVKKVFFVGLMLLPFVFWPWAKVPFEIPKVWFLNRWVEVLGVLATVNFMSKIYWVHPVKSSEFYRIKGEEGNKTDRSDKTNKTDTKNTLVLLVVLYLFIAVLASVLGVNPVKSLIGNYYRGDGLYTLFHLVGLFFLVNLFWNKSWEKDFIKVVAVGAVGVSLLGILGSLGIFGGWGTWIDGNIGITFGNPNFLGGYLLVCLPLIRRLGRLGYLGILGVIIAIILTGARGAMVGVGIWGILELVLARRKYLLGILGCLGILATVIFVSKNYWVKDLGLSNFGITADKANVFEGRGRIFQKAGMAFVQRPILGWGVANFDYAFSANDWPIKYNNDVYVDKAHSTLVENFVCLGILGGLGFLGIIGIVLVQLVKSFGRLKTSLDQLGDKGQIFLIMFLLYLFHSQTNVISINEEMMFWIVGGIVASGVLLDRG